MCLLFMISYVALSKIIKLRSDMKIYIYLLAKAKRKSRLRSHHFICYSTSHRHTSIMEKEGGDRWIRRPSPNLQKIVCNYSCHP